LIHGDAGSGKTHLLARLRAHNAREAEADGPGGLQEAIFISVRLHTSPRMLWRHLRSCLVNDLLRPGSNGETQLDRILLHSLRSHGLVKGDGQHWLADKRQQLRHNQGSVPELDDLFVRLTARSSLSLNLQIILTHLFLGRHRGSASAWLRAENLSDQVLERLGVTADYDEDDEPEVRARQTVTALSSLAAPALPIIFCFDHIEALALEFDSNDKDSLRAFGRMISTLQASAAHTLLISSIQTSFLDTLKSVCQADYDRIREQGILTLNPLTQNEAEQLVIGRLNAVPELRKQKSAYADPLWPLSREKLEFIYSRGIRPTPRQLFAHCAELYDEYLNERLVVPPIEDLLSLAMEERRIEPVDGECKVEEVLAHGLAPLLRIMGSEWTESKQQVTDDILALLENGQRRVAIISCDNRPGPGLVSKFRRIEQLERSYPSIEFALVRDPRLPIPSTAKGSRERRQLLINKGMKWIEPNYEGIATLDALRRLLSDALSGDLNIQGETICVSTVEKWLAEQLSPELSDLVDKLLPADSPPPIDDLDLLLLNESITGLLQLHRLISVVDVAARLERSKSEIIESVGRLVDRVGVLGDPPVVLFHLVSEGQLFHS
ncbi:MAG: hypothetical protein EBU88_07310, partial [Acidobacteria bacterium]|nr:hypothetical protein [Acidobacteriota bacterium]